MAVGVCGDVYDVAEVGGDGFEGGGGVVGWATWRLVVEVPEDYYFVVFGSVDSLGVFNHVDFDG